MFPAIKKAISKAIKSDDGGGGVPVIINTYLVNIINVVGNAADGTDPNNLRWTDILAGVATASNIINTTGDASTYNIAFAGFDNVGAGGRSPSDGVFPNNSWLTYIFTENGTVTFTISNLNDANVYDITLGASRNATASDRVGDYSVNGGAVQTLDGALDPPQTITFSDVAPISGVITLTMTTEADSSFSYLNFVKIDEKEEGSPITKQGLWDRIASLADFGLSVMRTSSGEGGAYADMTQTVLAGNNDGVQSFKGFGNNMPNVTNFLGQRALVPSLENVWYASEGGWPLLRLDTGEGLGYLRIHNGIGLEYETGPGSISPAIDRPFSVLLCMRVYPGARNERNGHFKERNSSHIAFVETTPEMQSTVPLERFKWGFFLMEAEAGGNNNLYFNDVTTPILTGTEVFDAMNELLVGANGHPIENHLAFQIYKFGLWTAQEKASLLSDTQQLYPNDFPTQPYYDTMHVLTSRQWNSSTKEWDLRRDTNEGDNLKVVNFGGGTGIEGTSLFQWFYWNPNLGIIFPENDKLDHHLEFPNADGQNITLNRNDYITGNPSGNPVIFTTGSTDDTWVACRVTPIDSNGVKGESYMTDWILNNIA